MQFQGFVISQAGAWNAPQGDYLSNGLWNFKSYMSLFPDMFSWAFLTFFILGLLSMYKLVLGFDLVIKNKSPELNKYLFLILIILIPIITVSFSVNHYFEDRYIMNSFPGIFIVASAFIIKSYRFIKTKNKIFAILFLILLLGFIGHHQLSYADALTKDKSASYLPIKSSGVWLNENSDSLDIIVTGSPFHVQYYAQRKTFNFPKTKEEFEINISQNPKIKFFMVSLFERHPEWAYTYAQDKNLTAVYVDFADKAQQQPILIIYELS